MQIYTIKDIARIAGVSVTTVSRVLNARPDVSPATRAAVERVIRECGFVGNAHARGLKQTESPAVYLIVRGRQNLFLNALTEQLLEEFSTLGTTAVTEVIDEADDEFAKALQIWRTHRVGGLLFVGSGISKNAAVLSDLRIPIVFVTSDSRGSVLPNAGSISVDDYSMGRMAVSHLLKAGHRNIAVFGANRDARDSLALRYQGARAAFTDAGIDPDRESYYIQTRFTVDDAYRRAFAFFSDHPEVTGVFAMSDVVAIGVIRALEDLGRHVPADVSVVGFDGIEIGRYTIPRLTTIVQPLAEIARESSRLLADMMHGGEPKHISVTAWFEPGDSVLPVK